MSLNRRRFIVIFCFIFFLATQMSYAAPILYRIQQKKAMEQRQQIQVQEMMEVHYHPTLLIEEQQQAPTYPQVVDHRNQAIAQAILNAHQSSGNLIASKVERPSSPTFFQRIVSALRYFIGLLKNFIDGLFGLNVHDQAIDTGNQEIGPHAGHSQELGNIQDQQQIPSSGVAQQAPSAAPASPADTQEVVDLSEVWKKLDKKSTVWTLLDDDQSKLLTVSEYIGRYQKEGVKINQPPAHYAQLIDQMAQGNPQMLQQPFGELLRILAIVDYDFDNGMDKDSLARQVLGEAAYEENKKRFSQPQQQQGQQQRP